MSAPVDRREVLRTIGRLGALAVLGLGGGLLLGRGWGEGSPSPPCAAAACRGCGLLQRCSLPRAANERAKRVHHV